jgi:saccharopine dehydrogenase-like NADP-dependent oxidoreductase
VKTIVLGGYGNFGSRICRALAGDASIQLVVGGRDLRRARALASELGGTAEALAIDASAQSLPDALRAGAVDLVIHAAGPFQPQGYGVAMSAAQANAHYIDLADGRRFVCDFAAHADAAFKAAQRTAISGASTVPALSSAVIDDLAGSWRTIDAIDLCIAPAQTAPRGRATLAAVLSYCGEPIPVWLDGRWCMREGWRRPERVTFARLRPRLGALCDIPDLELFPAHYKVGGRVMFRAAVEVGIAQRAFAFLAGLRSIGLIRNPASLAPLLDRVAPALDPFGTDLGGMVVRVEGRDASGRPARRAWHITADAAHGPEIPCMAATLLARRLAQGEGLPTGAFSGMGLLELADFGPEFARWGMHVDTLDETPVHGALPS